jgi:multiple sugar transport system permease protein
MTTERDHTEDARPGDRADGALDRPRRSDGGGVEEPAAAASRADGRTTGASGSIAERLPDAPLDGARDALLDTDVRLLDVIVYGLYGVAMLFFAFPVLWIVSASVRPKGDLLSFPFRFVPQEVSLSAYRRVFREGMVTWLFNSTVITLVGVGSIVVVSVPAAYAFSRFRFRGRRQLLGLVLLFQMISSVIIIVPLYSVMTSLDLIDTRIGLILLYVGIQTPFSIWLLKGYFDTIPEELDYAARIDGCNRLQTLRHVLLRPIAPGIAVVAIFNTVFLWSEFVLAYTVIGSEPNLYTISIGVYEFQSEFGNDWRAIAAASAVGMLPLVTVFLALQRYFVKGLIEGSLKGE